MNRNQLDIIESIKAEKLVSNQLLLDKILEILFPLILILALPLATGIEFYSNLTNNKPIGISLLVLILSFCLAGFLIHSIRSISTLKRINGRSRSQNLVLIKKIAKKHNWNIHSSNPDMTLINFSLNDTETQWSKQMTILYDENDILVNCISFGLYSNPSPFHWLSNRRKMNTLTTEFENGIKKANAPN